MLVEILTAFIPIHRLLYGARGLLPEGYLPYVGSATACMCISMIEFIITVGDEMVPAPEYMLSGMRALAFIRQ
jgi:hypothetical protein